MITIRPYEQGDWADLQKIHDSARKMELHDAKLDEAFLPLTIAAERENLFDYNVDVAVWNGQVVGFIAYSEEELAWLYVLPEMHRHGIGSALVNHAREKKPGLCELEVLEGNTRARGFYERCGFRVTDTVHGVMPGNEAFPVTVWCMTCDEMR